MWFSPQFMNRAAVSVTEIAPAAIPRNHTYFLSPLPPVAAKWLLLTHVGYTAVRGAAVNISM